MSPKSILLLILFCLGSLAYSQTFRFNQYLAEDGMSQDFIYSINQDQRGYLWIGTGEGLSKFDGRSFVTYTTADGLAEDVITCSFVDRAGNIWFGHNGGGITRFNHIDFQAITDEEETTSSINAISQVDTSIFFVSQNDGLFRIVGTTIEKIGQFDRENFQTVGPIDKNNMLVGTAAGIIHLKKEPESDQWKKVNIEYENEWFTDIKTSNTGAYVMASTQSGRIIRFRMFEGELQKSAWNDFDLDNVNIQSIMQDSDLNIWLATNGQGLIKLHLDTTNTTEGELTTYNVATGLSTNYVQAVFEDREGNIWIGTFGNGLSTLIDDFFTFFEHNDQRYGNSVSAIWVDESDSWYGVENGLIRVSQQLNERWKFYTDSTGLVDDEVTALHKVNSTLWIGTRSSGLYKLDILTEKIEKINWLYGYLGSRIHSIQGDENRIWAATEGGLIQLNPETNETKIFNTESGLPHNAIKVVFQDGDAVWLGTHSRQLYKIENEKILEYEISSAGEIEVIDIVKAKDGKLWLATERTGIYVFDGEGFSSYSTKNGLKSNYCYAIEEDPKGFLWVGHRGAMSRIHPSSGEIDIYDHSSGIEDQINKRSMFVDHNDYLWIGTDGGAVKYDQSKDRKNSVPPVINLLKVIINDQEYSIDEEIKLPYDNYRISFEFIGISFRAPEDVTYQFMLEGYDGVFSKPTKDPIATYGRIADGEYVFKVIACNEEGICSEIAARKLISIEKPFWKKWWFIVFVIVLFIGLIIFIIQVRLRRLKKVQVYLKTQLNIKTKEVVEKAEEIAQINKDLTSSINYAERIQQSILPNHSDLKDALPNSFIFFRPRDIVSGDFYYLEKIENKLIVVCADCTGHGVPGAFMSMIGSVAIRNIYEVMEITGEWQTPEKVLEDLDREVEIVLQQKSDEDEDPIESFFKSRDGMDLTICEINLDTHEVLLSAAMRTSLIRQNDEVKMISGDKRPIGGGENRRVDFTLQRFQMKKGDALFLFSDGYSDQFGGENRRKLKLMGVKKIVTSLSAIHPHEYETLIEDEFDAWQGEVEQIDDVLFMGLLF